VPERTGPRLTGGIIRGGAIIARSSGGVASEALDALRSQAVGLDQFIDRWVGRLTRRKQPWPAAPPALRTARAEL
jgi:hypothetical protein